MVLLNALEMYTKTIDRDAAQLLAKGKNSIDDFVRVFTYVIGWLVVIC